MSSTAILGFGSELYTSPDGTTWTLVGQTVDLNSPASELAKVKITNNSSPNTSQEYTTGIFEPGDMDFEIVYSSAIQEPLYTLFAGRTIQFWKEIFPDTSGWTYKAFISKLENEGKTENEAIHAKVSLALTTVAVYVNGGLS
jgi:hypothetical protein